MRVTYTLTVDTNAVPAGKIIRCWLPYPRQDQARQQDDHARHQGDGVEQRDRSHDWHCDLMIQRQADLLMQGVDELSYGGGAFGADQ